MHSFTYTGAISDFDSVEIKSGVVSFFGASTYTGTTTISGGTLIAANSTGSATGSGPVQVTGGTLGGNGSIGGAVTIGGGSGSAALAQERTRKMRRHSPSKAALHFRPAGHISIRSRPPATTPRLTKSSRTASPSPAAPL